MDKLKAMAIFVEIAEQGSMSAAARKLGVVNSVVSKNLTELETWLGRKLVYRSTRNMRLTQDGHKQLEHFRDILDRVNALDVHTDEETVQGEVKITAPIYLGHQLLVSHIPEFHRQYPLVKLHLELSDDFENMINEGFDVALRASQMLDSSFISRRLSDASLVVVASPDYISQYGVPSSPKALVKHQCLVEGALDSQRRWRFKNSRNEQVSVAVDGAVSTNSGTSIKQLCEAGLGIAQLPSFLVEESIASGKLVEVLPDYALSNFYLHLLYHQKGTRNLAVKAVVEYFVAKLSGKKY
ncbi:LysR family transcriptional regulator [Photobacterium alginatilyticum]|uniref:LysR family transcriptional regulator n=1 Tax=Photobacterium alginatilyticum TaxID=1775171 RepID=A0ABW9YM31_9GAMM|nr:LysR family transcriptional regulator [Photobacterium alginatilyticum]NBI54258.1 LysR family transcriptional regulator [Photobacterium alginatilyticum]